MNKREIRHGIKTVYCMLWDMLSLYEKTECFQKILEEGRELDAWDYMEKRLDEIKTSIFTLFLNERKIKKDLIQIVDETEYFVRQCEMPGVVERWLKLNPRLSYFDAVFDMMEEDPEVYEQICAGIPGVSVAFRPDEKLIADRRAYFQKIEQDNLKKNLKYSDEKMYQDELLRTLSILFEKTFEEYL